MIDAINEFFTVILHLRLLDEFDVWETSWSIRRLTSSRSYWIRFKGLVKSVCRSEGSLVARTRVLA